MIQLNPGKTFNRFAEYDTNKFDIVFPNVTPTVTEVKESVSKATANLYFQHKTTTYKKSKYNIIYGKYHYYL